MNVQYVWVDEYYAYRTSPGRDFTYHAKKGKCIRVEEAPKRYGDQRKRMQVVFEVEYNGGTREVTIPARQVINFWDRYERERAALQEEDRKREAEREARWERERKEQEERVRKYREERERIEAEKAAKDERLLNLLVERTGMPREAVTSLGSTTISLDRTTVELWLSAAQVMPIRSANG